MEAANNGISRRPVGPASADQIIPVNDQAKFFIDFFNKHASNFSHSQYETNFQGLNHFYFKLIDNKQLERFPEISELFQRVWTIREKQKNAPVPVPAAAAQPVPEEVKRGKRKAAEKREDEAKKIRFRTQLNSIERYLLRGNEKIFKNDSSKKEIPASFRAGTYAELGFHLLDKLAEEYPENKFIQTIYARYLTPVVPPAASTVEDVVMTPINKEQQELAIAYQALRSENYVKEKAKLNELDELCKDMPSHKKKIGKADELYIAFLNNVKSAIECKKQNKIIEMMTALTLDPKSDVLRAVQAEIEKKVLADVPLTEDLISNILAPYVYGSDPAPVDATVAQLRQLIDQEKIRHENHMDNITTDLVAFDSVAEEVLKADPAIYAALSGFELFRKSAGRLGGSNKS